MQVPNWDISCENAGLYLTRITLKKLVRYVSQVTYYKYLRVFSHLGLSSWNEIHQPLTTGNNQYYLVFVKSTVNTIQYLLQQAVYNKYTNTIFVFSTNDSSINSDGYYYRTVQPSKKKKEKDNKNLNKMDTFVPWKLRTNLKTDLR